MFNAAQNAVVFDLVQRAVRVLVLLEIVLRRHAGDTRLGDDGVVPDGAPVAPPAVFDPFGTIREAVAAMRARGVTSATLYDLAGSVLSGTGGAVLRADADASTAELSEAAAGAVEELHRRAQLGAERASDAADSAAAASSLLAQLYAWEPRRRWLAAMFPALVVRSIAGHTGSARDVIVRELLALAMAGNDTATDDDRARALAVVELIAR